MNTLIHTIKCGKCNGSHETVELVKACYFRPPHQTKQCMDPDPHPLHYNATRNMTCPGIEPSAAVAQSGLKWGPVRLPSWRDEPMTMKQHKKIMELGGSYSGTLTKGVASDLIDNLIKNPPRKVSAVQDAPNRKRTKIPLSMLRDVPDGYYATQQDETRPLTFFRISRPKSGKFKGDLKVQTQHGPDLKLAFTLHPSDSMWWDNMAVEDDLLLVVVDPVATGMRYADEMRHCMRCNTELTDEHSRWFGIGPECVKHWPHIPAIVEDRKGPFVPGWEKRSI